ncbi:MAG: carboxylating nicotinate-nucleotide diphosphorylase [Bacteroidia bacterium]|nr:carboxylating nicotinate-nucleotide diphosphorylase [Bacteroidia bacterium]
MCNFVCTMELQQFITSALEEDVRDGDHTSLSTIPSSKPGKARLLVKDDGILSGMDVAKAVFRLVDPGLVFSTESKDGDNIRKGQVIFEVEGNVQSILKAERLVLNCMQRMSGIATVTRKFADAVQGTKAKIMDTRKTTPLMRQLEKAAVKAGGGHNHRFGLYDMILIKDNHVDSAGGIKQALKKAKQYLIDKNLSLSIEIETRNLEEIKEALETGIPDRIMFDNFSPEMARMGVELVHGSTETEASGGITLENVRNYALSGVDCISVGALTHSVKSLDLSLKIVK